MVSNRSIPAAATLILGLASLAAATFADADQPYAVYDLVIEARYDDLNQQITGTERWVWRNTTQAPVSELQFHLYLNAFAHNRTTFMLESGGQLRGEAMKNERWGSVEVKTVRLATGVDLKGTERFLAPEDGNLLDQTVAAYTLPAPLAPGEAVELALSFEARLPEIFARTGVAGDYVFAGQWFPKLGVFEDAGVAGRAEAGWNVHQFHAASEFYADFGHYDVTLDLPARYAGRIGGTGRKVSEERQGERVRARFVARGVHDFAWTADSDTLVIEREFEPSRDVPGPLRNLLSTQLGRRFDPESERPIALRLLLQPEHRFLTERYLTAARAALATLTLRLGTYPYEELTLVDPPKEGIGSGGMEYPTLVTLGSLGGAYGPDRLLAWLGPGFPEVVTVHEIAHQYWYGMVASNETEESWIDEGFTSYFETKTLEDAYGSELGKAWGPIFGMRLGFGMTQRIGLLKPTSDPVALLSWRFRSSGSYGLNSYGRPATVLAHLEGLAGPAAFARAMRACFERWRWRHTSTAEIESCFTSELSTTLPETQVSDFFSQALHSTATLDFAVERLRNRWIEPSHGELPESGAPLSQSAPAEGFYRASVDIVRRGEFRHPVEIELRFDDGTLRTAHWNGDGRWERFQFDGPAQLTAVRVDPRSILALETIRLNNSLTAAPDRRPRGQLLTFLSTALGQFFQALSFFG